LTKRPHPVGSRPRTKRSLPIPPPGPLPIRRGTGWGAQDPFIWFERAARDNGKPHESPEPKSERALLALLQGKAMLVLMICLLVVVVAALLAVLIVKL
jgi:hypothetical protein